MFDRKHDEADYRLVSRSRLLQPTTTFFPDFISKKITSVPSQKREIASQDI
jgi:hypothetical protein